MALRFGAIFGWNIEYRRAGMGLWLMVGSNLVVVLRRTLDINRWARFHCVRGYVMHLFVWEMNVMISDPGTCCEWSSRSIYDTFPPLRYPGSSARLKMIR